MIKKAIVIFCLYASVISAQAIRLKSLGEINLPINDEDNSLNIYDYGDNPAWLVEDDQSSWIELQPSIESDWGSYKRYYTAEKNSLYNLKSRILKQLGNGGTLLGYASYNYDVRYNYNKSIEYNPYSGKAFFVVDSTSGNFSYKGPGVGFEYSNQIFRSLFGGLAFEYSINDGIKKIFSFPKTLIRFLKLKGALAYNLSEHVNLGISLTYIDNQESIESSDPGTSSVELYLFRGEKFAVLQRGENLREKIRTKDKSIAFQLFNNSIKHFEFGANIKYGINTDQLLTDKSASISFEESYSTAEWLELNTRSKYLSDNYTFGTELNFSRVNSWSKNSIRNLLLWKWDISTISPALGFSWTSDNKKLLMAIQYNNYISFVDSSKFIDSRFVNFTSVDHIAAIGFEKYVNNNFVLRSGCRYGLLKYDFIYGGKNTTYLQFTSGCSLILWNYQIDVAAYFENKSQKEIVVRNRSKIGINILIKNFSL